MKTPFEKYLDATRERNLAPIYGRAKSYYGKAKVVTSYPHEIDETKTLYSYGTKVASITYHNGGDGRTLRIGGYYSQTTARHINEFLNQNGFASMNKRQLDEYATAGGGL